MASGREIKTKIKSTQNMRKVTRALEMVSAAKIRRAQDLMKASRPYARLMRKVIAHVAQASTEFSHPFLIEREQVARVGYIVVSTDRGLCGGLNSNMFRRLKGVNLVGTVSHLGEKPRLEQLVGVIKVMMDAYTANALDRVFLAYS